MAKWSLRRPFQTVALNIEIRWGSRVDEVVKARQSSRRPSGMRRMGAGGGRFRKYAARRVRTVQNMTKMMHLGDLAT